MAWELEPDWGLESRRYYRKDRRRWRDGMYWRVKGRKWRLLLERSWVRGQWDHPY